MTIEIKYAQECFFESMRNSLDTVAKERMYIEMIEAPPLEKVAAFQKSLIEANAPVYYAVKEGQVIGWADLWQETNPRQSHRASLGMGVLSEYRGLGVGSQLLSHLLAHAQRFGLEKVELQVYTSNLPAIALYRKFNFEDEGVVRKYRKLDGQYFDCLFMGRFL